MKISIITVCYNAGAAIERTIQSVLRQNYPAIEYIVVDGASTDQTLDVIKKFGTKIDKVISEKDQGIYDAMNKGLAISTGDLVYFLNADDTLIDEDVLSGIARVFLGDPSKTLIYGRVKQSNVSGPVELFNGQFAIRTLDDFLQKTICHQAVFAHRSLFSKIGNFDCQYKYAADYEWLVRAYKYNPNGFFYVDKEIANYVSGGRSYQQGSITTEEYAKVRLKHLFSLKHAWYFSRYVILRGLKKRVLNEKW